MGKNNKGSEARKRAEQNSTCFLLLEPKKFHDSGEVARRLARCRGVEEVHLTSGKYGFVVSAKGSDDALESIRSAVRKVSGSRTISVAISHAVYR